jgi:hypothetical protein
MSWISWVITFRAPKCFLFCVFRHLITHFSSNGIMDISIVFFMPRPFLIFTSVLH